MYSFNAKKVHPLSSLYGNGEGFESDHSQTSPNLRQRYSETKRCWEGAPASPVSSKTISYK